jgi:hypothetical protein
MFGFVEEPPNPSIKNSISFILQLIIAGRKECYTHARWKRVIMSARSDNKGWGSCACVYHAPETIDGGSRN